MSDINDLELILLSKIPLVILETFEEPIALEMLAKVAIKRFQKLYSWTVTSGLSESISGDWNQQIEYDQPDLLLQHIKSGQQQGIFVLCDFHPYLDDPGIQRLIKDIVFGYQRLNCTLVLLSHQIDLPPDLKRFAARFHLSLPSEAQLHNLVLDEAKTWAKNHPGKRVQTNNATLQALVNNLRGLSLSDARRLIRGAIIDDGAINDEDLSDINKAKFELLDMDNILSYEYDTAQFAEVGGLSKLKKWLADRKEPFLNPTPKIEAPKGLLLLGVQGGGKSLAARSVAGLWQVPLLRLDMGSLYNKFIGETERNLRATLELADNVSPCVLWMDEIEKGVSGSGNDQGTSTRVLGTLLTWMAERKSQVFVVATSNDITGLPPELIRKGRLDEIFFVDLPKREERETIALIHLGKRQVSLDNVDVTLLAKATDGFTGAEIEQAIVSTIYTASTSDKKISTLLLLEEIRKTRPISITRAEDITGLRDWAKTRAVPAH